MEFVCKALLVVIVSEWIATIISKCSLISCFIFNKQANWNWSIPYKVIHHVQCFVVLLSTLLLGVLTCHPSKSANGHSVVEKFENSHDSDNHRLLTNLQMVADVFRFYYASNKYKNEKIYIHILRYIWHADYTMLNMYFHLNHRLTFDVISVTMSYNILYK